MPEGPLTLHLCAEGVPRIETHGGRSRVPELDHPVATKGRELRAIGAEAQAGDLPAARVERARLTRPVATSHSLTVPSRPAVATRRPPGWNAVATTGAAWPRKVETARPVAASETVTEPLSAGSAL